MRSSLTVLDRAAVPHALVTAFGGQPAWLNAPRWPLDTTTVDDSQLAFLGQIALDGRLFPGGEGTMVYLFVSEESEPLSDEAVVAVIQSPDGTTTVAADDGGEIPLVESASGPAVRAPDPTPDGPYGYAVVVHEPEPEPVVPVAERGAGCWDYDINGYRFTPQAAALAGNKIGGQPLYVDGLDTPPREFGSGEWLLLLQLAPDEGYWAPEGPPWRRAFYPFLLELGEAGILTAFISTDYRRFACRIQTG